MTYLLTQIELIAKHPIDFLLIFHHILHSLLGIILINEQNQIY